MAQVLRPTYNHPALSHEQLLVGVESGDDAGVYQLETGRALVQTVDFFTPIVDEAYDWGRIAAANALSDIYAMGGNPAMALQLVGWPRDHLPFDLLGELLAGGADVMASAATTIIGGHSIDDLEPKYGFAVTGFVDPAHMATNAAARPGDVLVLTKPLGMGIATTAIKQEKASGQLRDRAVEVMATLNGPAARVMTSTGVTCATDVTGYGLLGHLREVVEASKVGAHVTMAAIPVLDGIVELVESGIFPAGSRRNLDAVTPIVDGSVSETALKILADAQTSGGLLMAVNPDLAPGIVAQLEEVVAQVAVIGEITAMTDAPRITVS